MLAQARFRAISISSYSTATAMQQFMLKRLDIFGFCLWMGMSPCPTCSIKHFLRFRVVCTGTLSFWRKILQHLLHLKQYPMQYPLVCWSNSTTTKVIIDFRMFLNHCVAKIIRNEYRNKDDSLSLNTEPWSQSNWEWESSCLICRDPLTRLKGPSIGSELFLRMCCALPCDTRCMWLMAPVRFAKMYHVLRLSRRCVCGVRYDYIYRDSKIDNLRQMLCIWMRIFDFVVMSKWLYNWRRLVLCMCRKLL
jgi:hypothetical protein